MYKKEKVFVVCEKTATTKLIKTRNKKLRRTSTTHIPKSMEKSMQPPHRTRKTKSDAYKLQKLEALVKKRTINKQKIQMISNI